MYFVSSEDGGCGSFGDNIVRLGGRVYYDRGEGIMVLVEEEIVMVGNGC